MTETVQTEAVQPEKLQREISLGVGVDEETKQVVLLLDVTGPSPIKARFNYTAKEAAELAMLIAHCAQKLRPAIVQKAQPKLTGQLKKLITP